MNTFKLALVTLIFLSINATAQYGGGMYGNGAYGNGAYGGNRGMYGNTGGYGMQNNYPSSSKPDAATIEKERAAKIDNYMEKLKDELNLDELQFIAVKNEIIANGKSVDMVMKRETSNDEKSQDIKALLEKTDNEILTFLNPDQKEKYKTLVKERGTPGADKSSKKKFKNKDKDKENKEKDNNKDKDQDKDQ